MTLEKIKAINELTQSWMELRRVIEDIHDFPFKYNSSEDMLNTLHCIAEECRKEIMEDMKK